ncbi:MAG: 50S ribosomal protein L18 [bacterium]
MIKDSRKRRHLHLRHRVIGTAERPRLCVARSNRGIAVQLVDDGAGRVITGVSSLVPALREKKLKRMDLSREVGRLIAEQARERGIRKVVFDRAGYRYHGRVKAVAEAAREGGLEF